MSISKFILGLKSPSQFSIEERQHIIEEYLRSGCKKRDIWEKYTGEPDERGRLLRWMRQLGYAIPPKWGKLAGKKLTNMSNSMSVSPSNYLLENVQLKEKISQLEKALVHSELRATALETMINVAEDELYVSDITYWKIGHGHVYISLITDAYSHKIVGFDVSESLEATGSLRALQMALSAFLKAERHLQLIHHSDRGIQYCCAKYVKLLNDYNIQISMTENGDPLDNAIAERVNGILKEEYLECYQVESIKEAKVLLAQVIKLYNEQRPHMSIGNLAPEKVHSHILKKGEKK